MTVSQYIVEFLKLYEEIEIETNHLPEGADRNGLFKSPARSTREFMDGSYEVTESYQLFIRQPDISREEREESDEWLENLAYWVDDFPHQYEFPPMDGNRKVTNITAAGAPAPFEHEEGRAIYQLTLSIAYIREREV